jgi:ribosome-associated translation inhibitor RaiA
MRVEEAVRRYFDGGFGGYAVVERDGTAFRTHCTLHLDTGIDLQASATSHDPYASADLSSERIEKRLRRYKRRLRDHRPNASASPGEEAAYTVLAAPESDDDLPDGFQPMVIAEKKTRLRRLSVGDAVAELDMSGAPVVVFRHATSGRTNIVYRRLDGHIGWVDPASAADAAA